MKGRTMPRRYRVDGNGQVRRTWNGKFPEEFDEKDTLAFMAETDVLVHGEVTEETLDVIRQTGYAYENGTERADGGYDLLRGAGILQQDGRKENRCGKGRAFSEQDGEGGAVA